MSDIKYLSIAMKVLLVGYGVDLLFGDLRPECVAAPLSLLLCQRH